jgi:hypothetical protein
MLTSAKGIAIIIKAKIVTKSNITKVFKWRSILYVGGQSFYALSGLVCLTAFKVPKSLQLTVRDQFHPSVVVILPLPASLLRLSWVGTPIRDSPLD